jgi:hypothetical protein
MPLSSVVGAQSIIKPGVCTSSTRPAVPFEGQMIFETDTDRLYIYNGTAWVIPNSPAQNPTGLEFIKTQAVVAGEAATAVTNVFSATYDNYRVVVTGLQTSASQGLALKMGTTATGYYGNMVYALYNATAWTFVPQNNSNFWFVGLTDAGVPTTSSTFDLIAPFLSVRTQMNGGYYGRGYVGTFAGSLENSTSYTDFRFFNDSSGTMTAGQISVYGYRKS